MNTKPPKKATTEEIRKAIEATGGNIRQAAKALDISESAILTRAKKDTALKAFIAVARMKTNYANCQRQNRGRRRPVYCTAGDYEGLRRIAEANSIDDLIAIAEEGDNIADLIRIATQDPITEIVKDQTQGETA